MSGGYESSSSSEDSFTPVEDLHVCPYDLEPMTSSDGEEVEEHVGPVFHYLTVKNISSSSRNKMSRFNPWMEGNKRHRYFKALARKEDDLKMFPKAMQHFLSGEHPNIYTSLLKLDNGEFFIYLGKSLVVTLNIENSRVRIPTSLILDACVFSVNHPVVVISVFQQNTNDSRMNMYNTFLARGVTEALRSYSCENVSVKKGAITVDCNVHEAVHKFQKEATEFQNTSFFEMSKSKAENLVEALLRSSAVSSTYLVINPKEDPNLIWFLNMEEFEFLMEFIDLVPVSVSHTVDSDSNLIALEMVTRLGKRHKTVLLLSSIDANVRDHFKSFKNITVCEAPDALRYSKNSLIITDYSMAAFDIQKGIRNIISVSSSKSGGIDLKGNFEEPEKSKEQLSKQKRPSIVSDHFEDVSSTTRPVTTFHRTSSNSHEKAAFCVKDLIRYYEEPEKSNKKLPKEPLSELIKKRTSEQLKVSGKDTSKKLSDKSSQTPQSFSIMEENTKYKPLKSRLGKLSPQSMLTTSSDESDINVEGMRTSHQVDDDLLYSIHPSVFESLEDISLNFITGSRGSSVCSDSSNFDEGFKTIV